MTSLLKLMAMTMVHREALNDFNKDKGVSVDSEIESTQDLYDKLSNENEDLTEAIAIVSVMTQCNLLVASMASLSKELQRDLVLDHLENELIEVQNCLEETLKEMK